MIRIEEATALERIEQVRQLFLEYADWTGIDLCFQGFGEELAGLPGRYTPPRGRLLLALEGKEAVGCVALRDLGAGTCEMKRLYVRASHRGRGLGRQLVERLLRQADTIGYDRIRLDTLPMMHAARKLYAALGFREIPPYYPNPLEGVLYMELDLRGRGAGTRRAGPDLSDSEAG